MKFKLVIRERIVVRGFVETGLIEPALCQAGRLAVLTQLEIERLRCVEIQTGPQNRFRDFAVVPVANAID